MGWKLAERRVVTPGWKAVARQGCVGRALLPRPVNTQKAEGPVSAEPRGASPRRQLEETPGWDEARGSLRKKEEPQWEAGNAVRASPDRPSAGWPPRQQQRWTDTRGKSTGGLPGR